MKTIFISAYNPFISRNIFSTDVLKILRKQTNLRVVIFVPSNKKEFIEKTYGGDNVIIEAKDLEPIYRTAYNKFWYRLAFLLQNSRYVKDQRGERLFRHRNIFGYINFFWVSSWAFIFSTFSIFRNIYRFLDYNFSPQDIFQEFFDKYSPSVVFSTDIFSEADALFLRQAKNRRIPTIGMVRSWDNTTTKGVLRLVPGKIIVNGFVSKDELVKFHGCNEKNISVVGLPQFDSWLGGPTQSREEFFSKIKADPAIKLILFAPAGSILSDTDWQLCQILKEAIDNGSLPDNVQFLVRNHPHHPADLSRFDNDKRFIIEIPGADKSWKGWAEFDFQEANHLRNSVYYSDIVMYVATSLGLDAAVYNKPQILISFDGWESRPYVKSVRRFNREDCLASLVKLGGTKVVYSKEEWIEWINKYLADPTIDNDGRKKIEERQMFKLDGQAGKRIADIIINEIKN